MTMKLSEAIRLGAMMRPQGFGSFCDANGRTCALGAAAEAVGIAFDGACSRALNQEWPKLVTCVRCPACGASQSMGGCVSACLNDSLRWTREQIADWVEQIERRREQPEPAEAEVART